MTDNVIWDFSERRYAQLMDEAAAHLESVRHSFLSDLMTERNVIPFSTDEYVEPPCA